MAPLFLFELSDKILFLLHLLELPTGNDLNVTRG